MVDQMNQVLAGAESVGQVIGTAAVPGPAGRIVHCHRVLPAPVVLDQMFTLDHFTRDNGEGLFARPQVTIRHGKLADLLGTEPFVLVGVGRFGAHGCLPAVRDGGGVQQGGNDVLATAAGIGTIAGGGRRFRKGKTDGLVAVIAIVFIDESLAGGVRLFEQKGTVTVDTLAALKNRLGIGDLAANVIAGQVHEHKAL